METRQQADRRKLVIEEANVSVVSKYYRDESWKNSEGRVCWQQALYAVSRRPRHTETSVPIGRGNVTASSAELTRVWPNVVPACDTALLHDLPRGFLCKELNISDEPSYNLSRDVLEQHWRRRKVAADQGAMLLGRICKDSRGRFRNPYPSVRPG